MCVCAACTLTSRVLKHPVAEGSAKQQQCQGSEKGTLCEPVGAPPGTSQAPVTHSAWSWQRPPATITAAPHFSEAVMLNQSIRCATRSSSAVDSLRTCEGSNHHISGLPCSFIWVQFTWWSHYISVLRKVFLPLWLCTALGKSITPRQATNPLKCTHTEMHCPGIKGVSSPRYTESHTHQSAGAARSQVPTSTRNLGKYNVRWQDRSPMPLLVSMLATIDIIKAL